MACCLWEWPQASLAAPNGNSSPHFSSHASLVLIKDKRASGGCPCCDAGPVMLVASRLLFTPVAPPAGRCVVMNAGSMWSELRERRASEFSGEDGLPSAKEKPRKRDSPALRFQRMVEATQPFFRNLRPPLRRISPDADEYIPGPGLALTVVWDRQGPFVVETDESASVKARRIRQARATEAGLRRQQLVERVEAVEADLLALMAVAPVPERALRSAIEEARTLGIPKRSPHLFRTAAALLELLERASAEQRRLDLIQE